MSIDIEELLGKVDDEIARVKIGFVDGETPRLLTLLQDAKLGLRLLRDELREEQKKLKRLQREASKPTPKPVLSKLTKTPSKRQKKKAKRFRSSLSPSRRRNLV